MPEVALIPRLAGGSARTADGHVSPMLCEQAACKDAEVLPRLLVTVQRSQSPEVQLLAAQTLRKHVPRDWRRLSSQVRLLRSPAQHPPLPASLQHPEALSCPACVLPQHPVL